VTETLRNVLLELFSEAYTGPNGPHTWFIDNRPGSGILGTLEGLSAEDASRPSPTGSTIAAHAEHLRWSLALTNAYVRGENPTPSWAESWSVTTVTAKGWDDLRADLRREYEAVFAALSRQTDVSDPQTLTGILALTPHAAYHLGALRQRVNAL
jgi:hypothetical protein